MLLDPNRTEFDIFIGSRIGSFKHIKYHTDESKNSKKCIENLQEISALRKGDAVTCMRWADASQRDVLIGRANGVVQTYDTEAGAFVKSVVADHGKGGVVGLGRLNRKLVTALSGGTVRVWGKRQTELDAGGELDRMRMCEEDEGLIATGGKENDLKVWRLGTAAPIFAAKNVRHDQLELRAPVWATDVCFLPGGGTALATCSRYGTVRLYDTRAQRRPVCEITFPNMAASCIAPAHRQLQVLVGFGRGQLHMVDLRGKGRPDKGFKGSVGAVTDACVVPGTPYVLSVGLDRHVKIHSADTKRLIYKQYVTSKLSSVLAQTERSTPLTRVKLEPKEETEEIVPERRVDDMDVLFEDMETVGDRLKTKRKRPDQQKAKKKVKQIVEVGTEEGEQAEVRSEGSAEAESEEDETEAGIAKLLKLTEKKKRKMDKLKKKKKAKSVFHNA